LSLAEDTEKKKWDNRIMRKVFSIFPVFHHSIVPTEIEVKPSKNYHLTPPHFERKYE